MEHMVRGPEHGVCPQGVNISPAVNFLTGMLLDMSAVAEIALKSNSAISELIVVAGRFPV